MPNPPQLTQRWLHARGAPATFRRRRAPLLCRQREQVKPTKHLRNELERRTTRRLAVVGPAASNVATAAVRSKATVSTSKLCDRPKHRSDTRETALLVARQSAAARTRLREASTLAGDGGRRRQRRAPPVSPIVSDSGRAEKPAARPLAARLLLRRLQDSVAWLAPSGSSSGVERSRSRARFSAQREAVDQRRRRDARQAAKVVSANRTVTIAPAS